MLNTIMGSHLPHPFGIIGLASMVMVVTGASQFIEDSTIRLPTVCAVGAVVLGGAWQLSRKFQRIEDRLDDLWCTRHPDQCQFIDKSNEKVVDKPTQTGSSQEI
jgi:hypothetical protein